MDLTEFSLKDLLETAIKSEIESNEIYLNLRSSVKDSFLRDRLQFIADEEASHRNYLTGLYVLNFKEEPTVPERSAVPLPTVKVGPAPIMASEVVIQAMEAEKTVSDFYLALSEFYPSESDTAKILKYLSRMEMGHYGLLETERDRLTQEEDFELEWPMMHAGP